MSNRYYTPEDFKELQFYKVPKALVENPIYDKVSLGAKLMYGILCDRQALSVKNNWIDADGYIFSIYRIDPKVYNPNLSNPWDEHDPADDAPSLTELLRVDRKTIMKFKKELVGAGLLVDKRIGCNRPNHLYVMKPEVAPHVREVAPKNGKITPETPVVERKSKKGTSTSVKNGLPEAENLDPNKTEIIKTEIKELKDECMNGARVSDDTHDDPLSDDKLSEIYQTLKDRQKGLVTRGMLCMSDTELDTLFARLTTHKENRHLLNAELINTACDIYEGAYSEFDAKFNLIATTPIKNPIGAFLDCYKQAIPVYRAKLRAEDRR